MLAYENHLRATNWLGIGNMVTYDFGVMVEFEHLLPSIQNNPNLGFALVPYIGECKEILELDYGGTMVPMLLCSWLQARTWGIHAAMRRNEFVFTLVNFKGLVLA
jgi:hypothetical protein